MIDVTSVRAQFPALDTPWALFDNAGGSPPAKQVIDRVADYMSRHQVQLGASYPISVEAAERVAAGKRAMEAFVGADEGEVILGPSTTVNVRMLAGALRPLLRVGDEIVVTNLDHESNIGPWLELESAGITVREWRFDRESRDLEWRGLEPLLSDRTRLVCFTHCSNVTGSIHDVAALADRIREAGAWSCVDGVAFAPHRSVDVKALGVDFYLTSLYKTFGPHLGLLYGRRELLLEARGQNHFFVAEDDLPYKFEPGNVNHELVAALPGILEYLAVVAGVDGAHDTRAMLGRAYARIADHEQRLAAPLLELLASNPRVQVVGPAGNDAPDRVPTISFVVDGVDSATLPPRLDERKLAVRFGHFYAYRAIRDMGLLEQNGVVRVSMAHYNSMAEVGRLVEALDELLR